MSVLFRDVINLEPIYLNTLKAAQWSNNIHKHGCKAGQSNTLVQVHRGHETDDVVLFKPLSLEEITEIVDLLLAGLNKRIEDRKVSVVFTSAAKKWIGEKGYDPTYGARPLKRFLQKQVETQLARALVTGEVEEGSEVAFSVKDDELVMKVG